jgi:ATP-binding cassette subfamily F protein uup
LLDDYDGTVLLVSHDRDFLDRVAATTIAMEGDGRATVYAGGWSDYQAQRAERGGAAEWNSVSYDGKRKGPAKSEAPSPTKSAGKSALSFTQKHRLEALPGIIATLEAEIAKLETFLSAPDIFTKEPVKFRKGTEALAERQQALAAAEEEWLDLEAKAEG